MGKKEPSKGREWEKGRRDILNQTFHELYKALPSYSNGVSLSKKTILTQALAHIRQLEENSSIEESAKESLERSLLSKSTPLVKWILSIASKVYQLASLLKASGISAPQELVSFEAPPLLSDKLRSEIICEIEKIGPQKSSKTAESCQLTIEKEPKPNISTKQVHNSSLPSKSTSSQESASLKKDTSGETKNAMLVVQDSKGNGGASFVQSSSVVVQPSPSLLPPQLVFAPGSSSSPMATSLPLLVSVTGVKTVNPLILVQSNVMASAPSLVYTQHRIAPRCSQARPIQPGPPSKTNKKLKKIPIPSLRQKPVLPASAVLKSGEKHQNKSIKRSLVGDLGTKKIRKNVKCKLNLKSSRRKSKISSSLEKLDNPSEKTSSKCNSVVQESRSKEISDADYQKDVQVSDSAISVISNSYGVPEIDKENVALNGGTPKLDCDSKTTNFAPFSTSTSNIVSEKLDYTSSAEIDRNGPVIEKHGNEDSVSQPCLGNKSHHDSACASNKSAGHIVDTNPSARNSSKGILPSDDVKHTKGDVNSAEDAAKSLSNLSTSGLQHSEEATLNPSTAKTSKSNYSISALCAQQQLLQHPETSQARQDRSSEALQIHNPRSNIPSSSQPLEARSSNELCLNTDKSKDLLPPSDNFAEWSEKSRCKGERSYSNFSLFSNFAVHTNKNSFIPINDMEGYKPIPDTFDSSENSFGLPLTSSDITGDLFASLQVPPGSQHPESISPTAAYLLTFPLVSSSKVTELEDSVCENNDSQSGIKTILQIGNLDGDTPVTNCVNVFSSTSADVNSIVYREPSVFSHDTLSEVIPKSKSMDPRPAANFPEKEQTVHSQKVQDGTLQSSASGKGTNLSKNAEDPQNQHGVKSCQSRSISAAVDSAFNNMEVQSVDASRILEKNLPKPSPTSAIPRNDTLKINGKSSSNHAQEISPFLNCLKQQDWSEVSSTSQSVHAFSDFPTLSSTRTDCSINFPIPSNIASLTNSSNVIGDSVVTVSVPSYRSQSSSSNSILSWSTLPVLENTITTKSHKLAPFQDTFPPSKTSEKHNNSQAASIFCSNISNSESSYHQQMSSSGFHINDKLNPVTSHFSQDPNINLKAMSSSNLYGQQVEQKQFSNAPRLGIGGRQNSSVNFSAPNKVIDPKKMQQSMADAKQNSNIACAASKGAKTSLRTVSNRNCSHQSSDLHNKSPQVSSSGLAFPATVEGKQKSRDSLGHQGDVMGTKSCLNVMNQNQVSKDSTVPQLNQNAAIHELKSAGSSSACTSLKGLGDHNSIGNFYDPTNNSVQKQSEAGSTGFGHSAIGHKKDNSPFNQNPAVSKHITPVPNYNMNLNNSGPYFSNAPGVGQSQQQPYKIINIDPQAKHQTGVAQPLLQQRQLPQQQQPQQNCVQSSKESSTSMMHRPPVNWMTAPDIRSHQHHNGPSFGNSSNMSATQGILYLPDSESSGPSSVFDSSSNFHCVDIPHSGQSFYKSSELHLFGNEGLENIHENSSWSPNKSGSSSMLGNMLIPSTLPTLVGDLALGDNNISRPLFPAFSNNESVSCPKKSKRATNSRRGDKVDELNHSLNQECSGSFLSVSQLVDTGTASKIRHNSFKESLPFAANFSEQDNTLCPTITKQITKSISSNYSTEALLSTSSIQQLNQSTFRKRRTPGGTPYHNNYIASGAAFHNNNINNAPQTQTQFIPDVGTSRTNDFQGSFIHTDPVSSFMLGASSRPQRNHPYNVTNERPVLEDQSSVERSLNSSVENNETSGAGNIGRQRPSTSNTSSMAPASSNIMDFGYINMQPTMLSEDLSFSSHHPHPPPFLPPHTYPPQEALYPASRLSMHHPSQNNNVQSPSATTLANFHLSTIFPEMNEKVIC